MSAPNTIFAELRQALNTRHIERREEVEIALWALLSRFHVCYIGPPGTAKSMLSRDIAKAIVGAKYFERLMTKYSVPEEFFGPYDIPALQLGHYRRIVENYLPEADIAFLDEIWKANSAVINALLTIMNERIFHNNGSAVEVPLQTLFAASNEMPEGEELWAMFDRFQFRKVVNYIEEPGNFVEMIKGVEVDIPELSFDDLSVAQASVLEVEINDTVYETLNSVKADLKNEGIIGSDRRYKQSLRAMQASAFLEGRDYVDDDDFKVLVHMMWSNPQDVRKVERLILDNTNPRDRKVIESNIVDTPEFHGNVTISIGVAVRSPKHVSAKDMIKEADEALYAAKEAGRNKVCISMPE